MDYLLLSRNATPGFDAAVGVEHGAAAVTPALCDERHRCVGRRRGVNLRLVPYLLRASGVHRYRLHLFGEPTLHDPAGATIPLWRPMVALLALISGSPGGVLGRDRAAAMLWPESDEATARLALRQLLFRLRRAAPIVAADRERIRLQAAVDVVEFEAAVREGRTVDAAASYRGAFLDGFSLPGSAEFDQWCDTERERLRRAAAPVFADLADSATARGRWAEAVTAALRALDLEPYGEEAAGRAIAAYAQLGDRAAALALFESFQRRLSAELGAAPGLPLERLVGRIRRLPPRVGSPSEAERGGVRPLELPLVGREEEFAGLSATWARAAAGRHQLILLRGEPGIGKTRLAQEFRRWAAVSGATTLTCSAYEIEAGVPYAALAGALREALHAPGLGGVDARTVVELSRIVPDYAGRFPAAETRREGGLEAGHLRIMEAWRDLLDSLAHEAPVLLVVDDIPWADEASLAALHYGWRTLPDGPIMILATARGAGQEELGSAAGLVAAALREGRDTCTALVLGPLDRPAVAAAAEPADVDRADESLGPAALERRSGGNPLFLVELLRAAAEGGVGAADPTETIRLVTLERIDRLDPGARSLLQAAAILGRQFPLPLAAAVAELPAGAEADAVDSLLSRGLLRQVGYGYDFVHDVVREVVRDAIGSARRAGLHGRAFAEIRPAATDHLEALGPERIGALARHAAAAGLTAEAHRWHLRAARAAVSLYAPAEAARALGRALELAATADERRQTWESIGELARARSDFRGAAVAYREALATADREEDRLRLRLSVLHMGDRAGLLDTKDVETLGATLRPEAEAAGPEPLGQLLFIMGAAHARAGSFEKAVDYATTAADALRAASAPRALVRALLLQASVLARVGRGDALTALGEAERVALHHGLSLELSDVRVEMATELSRRGRWDDAIAGFERIRGDASEAPDWGNSAIACLNVADLQARRGEWEAATAALADAEQLSERFDFPHVAVVARLNRALLAWLGNRPRDAAAAARQARSGALSVGLDAPAVAAAAIEALALLETGEPGEAAEILAAVAERDAAAPHPSWSDDAELLAAAQARLLAANGETAAARDLLQGAHARAREPYARALLTLEQAMLEHATGAPVATELATDAFSALRALGAGPLAERAAALIGTASQAAEVATDRAPERRAGHRRRGPG
jgi:DNA-binding SARP family transcriptional activator